MAQVRRTLLYILALGTVLFLAGAASAAPTPDAGGDRTVDEDSSNTYTGSDASGEGVNVGWTFDGNIVDGNGLSWMFTTPGSYAVDFWADDTVGGNVSDSITVTVTDITAPTGSGSVPSSANEDASVALSSAAISDNDPNFASDRRDYWTFTDGSAQNLSGSSQSYTFNTPGTYAITLTVMDAAGNKITQGFSITIADVTAPNANAGTSQAVDEDTVVTLDASATTDNDPNFASNGRYYWTFNNQGTPVSLTGVTATFTFATPGTYTVTLLVLDAAGNFASAQTTIAVGDITAPTGSATVPASADEDTPVSLLSSAVSDNDPSFASNRRDYWTFTDVTARNLSGPSATYTFANPGTFSIDLLVMDAAGNQFTSSFSITVNDVTDPVASWTISPAMTFNEDAQQTLTAAASSDNVAVTSWSWSISDTSGTSVQTGQTTTYTWATPGTYSVTLTVQDAAGNSDAQARSVTVRDITAPTGSGSVPTSANEDTSVAFSSGTIADNDPSFGTNGRFYWTFTAGTAQNLSGTSPSFTFATPGTYSITLLVMDAAGNRLSSVFSITIADVTPPVASIATAFRDQTRQQFSSMTHTGTATDNAPGALTYGWGFTENAVLLNVSGASMARAWAYTSVYTLTFWARDVAGNVGTATTTFTVTPDVTAPTVSFLTGPTAGDDVTALTYTASATDNNPNCSTLCTYEWQVDGIQVSTGSLSLTYTFTAGRHTVTILVTDPASNIGSASRTVDVDQLISVDTTWDAVNQPLNWNVRVTNGATFTISNSVIQNATTGINVRLNVTNGRLIIENSQFVATSTTNGFLIQGVRGPIPASVTVYINNSTIGGIFDWITVVNGTLSVRQSTINNVRGANLGAIYTLNSNTYLTDVTINANTLSNTNGIRAEWTSYITVALMREIVLQNVQVTSSLTPIRTFGFQVSGTIVVNIRDTALLSSSTASTVRGIDQFFWEVSGFVQNIMMNVNSQAIRGGGLFGIYHAFTGTLTYNVSDSNFSGSLSGNGTTIQLVNSNSQFAYDFNNVAFSQNSLAGAVFRFANTTANVGTWNQGTIALNGVSSFNNTQDGLLFEQTNTRLTASIDIATSVFSANRRHGLFADTRQGHITALAWRFTDDFFLSNTLNGIQYNSLVQRVNVSMDFLRTKVDSNLLAGFNLSATIGTSFDALTRGAYWINFSDSTANFNGNASSATTGGSGLAFYEVQANSNNQFFVDILRSELNLNRKHGIEWITYYASQSYRHGTSWYAPFSDRYITMEDSSVSSNTGNGIFTHAHYCGYGTTNSTFPSSCLFSFNVSRSHIDNNNGRGMFLYYYYGGYYGSSPLFVNLVNDSTVDNNGAAGIYEYHYYTYMYNVAGGRPSDTEYNIVNASLSYNGRVNNAEGYGLFTYFYYDYYLFGQRRINTDNASFIGNKNSGYRLYVYYGYYGNPLYRPNLFNSTFIDNGGAAFDPYYYYTYQCGVCVQENIEQNLMVNNQLGAIRAGLPQSAGRYFSGYIIRYVNNIIDQSPVAAITSYVSYSYSTYYYSGNNQLNISGNRISNVSGAAISYAMDPPQTGGTVLVDFSNNWIEDTTDTSALFMPGSMGNVHTWFVVGNTFVNTSTSALVLNMINYGSGNSGGLSFERNTFRDTQGTAFSLVQSNIVMTGMLIRDCVFINSQIGIDLTGINGVVRNATFQGSIKSDIQLANGALEIHETPVNPDLLTPIGSGSFSVFFSLKIYVVWSGSLRPAAGSIVELADALGTTFFVGSVTNADGLPEFESLSYTKNTQGVLGRSPFRATVNYFELNQEELIPLPADRVVNILLRDDVPPTMVLASPTTDYATRSDTVQVEGTAYDSHSGFTFDQNDSSVAAQFVEISTDNANWQTPEVIQASTGEIAFRLTLTGLDESVEFVYVRIHDEAGNYYTRVVPVILDRTPPTVTILNDVPSITRGNSVHIEAETEVGTQVFVNGISPAELFTRPDGVHVFFTMDVAIIEGPNTITVMAMDLLRNQGRVTLQVTADREAPYLVINSPEQDALVRGTTVDVKGHVADRNSVTVTVDGIATTLDSDGNFSIARPIQGDITRIEAIATDAAGNQVILVRVVRFDEIKPWVTLENPPEGTLIGTTEVPVSGVVEQGATLVINGETVDSPRGVFSRRILLVEGNNTIHVEATDYAGNKEVLDRNVIVDTHKPVIVVSSVADQTLWAHPSILLAGRITDEHQVTLELDGLNVVLTEGAFSTDVPLREGINVLHLVAEDAAGNVERLDIQIDRDTTAPIVAPNVEGLVPDAGQYYTTQPAVSVVGIAEPGSIVEVCYTEEVGGRECNVVPLASDGSFRTFVDLVPNTKNTITVRGTDAAGNVATRDFSVTQQEAVVVPIDTPLVAYGMAAAALGILGLGGYFLMMSRRSRARQDDLSGEGYLAPAPYEAPVASHVEMAPAVVAPPPPPRAQPSIASVPPEEQLVDAEAGAKPKVRPMRRRPVEGGAGAEGPTDKGSTAESEAGPSDNQPETKKEGDQ